MIKDRYIPSIAADKALEQHHTCRSSMTDIRVSKMLSDESPAHETCRLCGERVDKVFQTLMLFKFQVNYYRCSRCRSLQTENPYWLADAYSTHNLAVADTGAVHRSLNCQAMLYTAARVLRFEKNARILDFGGGNGLLCRLLRDRGFEARVVDPHAINDFAQGFEDDGGPYQIVSAFEVAEHFANPANDMESIFGRRPSLVCLGTATYEGQGPDWWYLAPASGQHVFFYAVEGMRELASKYTYNYVRIGDIHLFLDRPFTRIERALLCHFLDLRRLGRVRAYLGLKASAAFAQRDLLAAGGN